MPKVQRGNSTTNQLTAVNKNLFFFDPWPLIHTQITDITMTSSSHTTTTTTLVLSNPLKFIIFIVSKKIATLKVLPHTDNWPAAGHSLTITQTDIFHASQKPAEERESMWNQGTGPKNQFVDIRVHTKTISSPCVETDAYMPILFVLSFFPLLIFPSTPLLHNLVLSILLWVLWKSTVWTLCPSHTHTHTHTQGWLKWAGEKLTEGSHVA